MQFKFASLTSLTAAVCLTLASHAQANSYSVTALGTLGGRDSRAADINNLGQVIGSAMTADNVWHASSWSGNTITLLGGAGSYGQDINDAGISVGYQIVSNRDGAGDTKTETHAFRWNGTTQSGLGANNALGINNSNVVVGGTDQLISSSYGSSYGPVQAWRSDSATSLTNRSSIPYVLNSQATDINDSGQAAGYIQYYFDIEAALWNGNKLTTLNGLGGTKSWANAINNAGQVVGSSYTASGVEHATFWNGSTVTDLGLLGGSASWANSINSTGLITGAYRTLDGSVHAALWNGTSGIDLNSFLDASIINEGWVLSWANGINDQGQIVGTATNTFNASVRRGFVMTPSATPEFKGFLPGASFVPEPATYGMMFAGLGLTGLLIRRRRRASN